MSVAAPPPPPFELGRREPATSPGTAASWLAFCALALYATLRWGTMLEPAAQGRLFISLLLSMAMAAGLRWLLGRPSGHWAVLPVVIAGLIALLGIAGFPLTTHVGRLASRLSDGVNTFGDLLVPYNGGDPNVAAALVLSGGGLLFAAAVVFAGVRRAPGTARLALTAAPLLALAVIPSTIVAPEVSYLHGLLTFVLVTLLVFSPRLIPEARGSGLALLSAAAVLGAVGAGVIAGDRLWVHTNHPSGAPVSGPGMGLPVAEQFRWQQTYGTLGWPYTGASVLEVTARRPAHWKAEDLDSFDGRGWTTGQGDEDPGLVGVSAAHLAEYTETLNVNVDEIASNQIITAGYAYRPDISGVAPGSAPGTWVSEPGFPLRPGDDYAVRVYAPDPSDAQLAAAGSDYPAALAPFRSLALPSGVYAEVQALADRLHAGTDSPYAYVEAVLDYLQHGYVYTLDPPKGGTYPLVNFLLNTRRGYCQQFAGAMALLLRMEGVPARVAVGFSSGVRRTASHTYVVADFDAHAWVEAWFPTYGWVTFDPTPGTATVAGATPTAAATSTPIPAAQTTSTPQSSSTASQAGVAPHGLSGQPKTGAGARAGTRHTTARGSGSGSSLAVVALALAGVLLAGLIAVILRGFSRRPSTAALTVELEHAFAVSRQPLDADVTLADLERLLADSPAAAGYVRALAASRYTRATEAPTAQGRAALRRWLAQGGGAGARLRALAALPPRRRPAGA